MAFSYDNHTLRGRLRFWWMLPLVVILGLYLVPAFQTTENVTVLLDDCVTESCELKGDLSVSLFTGDYVLTQADGTTITFAPERVSFMQRPMENSKASAPMQDE